MRSFRHGWGCEWPCHMQPTPLKAPICSHPSGMKQKTPAQAPHVAGPPQTCRHEKERCCAIFSTWVGL